MIRFAKSDNQNQRISTGRITAGYSSMEIKFPNVHGTSMVHRKIHCELPPTAIMFQTPTLRLCFDSQIIYVVRCYNLIISVFPHPIVVTTPTQSILVCFMLPVVRDSSRVREVKIPQGTTPAKYFGSLG